MDNRAGNTAKKKPNARSAKNSTEAPSAASQDTFPAGDNQPLEAVDDFIASATKEPKALSARNSAEAPSVASQDTRPAGDNQPLEAAAGIFIANAGLALLGPFLPVFFDKTGLVKNESFREEAARQRAVHLLQYLVDFHPQPAEYHLCLNKLLCGLPLEDPVPQAIELTELEKREARQLLTDAIEYWSALKSTSPESLQNTFLQRLGKLHWEAETHCWVLRIEKQTFDILLDKIPWSYSVIRHPWMPTNLRVEW